MDDETVVIRCGVYSARLRSGMTPFEILEWVKSNWKLNPASYVVLVKTGASPEASILTTRTRQGDVLTLERRAIKTKDPEFDRAEYQRSRERIVSSGKFFA